MSKWWENEEKKTTSRRPEQKYNPSTIQNLEMNILWNYLLRAPFQAPLKNKKGMDFKRQNTPTAENHSRLESKGQPKPRSFVQRLGVKLARESQYWLWYDLMLQESPEIAVIIELCFHVC